MPIRLRCHSCGKKLQVDDAFAGSLCRCIQCGALSEVPAMAGVDESNRPSRPVGPGTKKTETKKPGEGSTLSQSTISRTKLRPLTAAGKNESTGRHGVLQRPGRPAGPGGAPAAERPPAPGRKDLQESTTLRTRSLDKYADGRVIVAATTVEETKRRGILTLILLGVAVLLMFVLALVVIMTQKGSKPPALAGTSTPAAAATSTPVPAESAVPAPTTAAKPPVPGPTPAPTPMPAATSVPPTATAVMTPTAVKPPPIPSTSRANFLGMAVNPAGVLYVVDTAKSMTQERMDVVADLLSKSITSCPENSKVSLLVPDTGGQRFAWIGQNVTANPDTADLFKRKLLEMATGQTNMDHFMRAVNAGIDAKPATLVVVTAGTRDKAELAKLRDKALKNGTAIIVLNIEAGEEGSFKTLASDPTHYFGRNLDDLRDWVNANSH